MIKFLGVGRAVRPLSAKEPKIKTQNHPKTSLKVGD